MVTYNLTNSLTNITTGNITVTLLADQGTVLPASTSDITVSGGNIVSYNSSTGELVVPNTVTSISCTCKTPVTIKFSAGADGQGTMADQSAYVGDTYTLPACAFTGTDDYTFNE